MIGSTPRLEDAGVVIRGIRMRDARALERELVDNRAWLQRWEATLPGRNSSAARSGEAPVELPASATA